MSNKVEQSAGVGVLAVLSRRAGESCAKYGADCEDMKVLSVVAELIAADVELDAANAVYQESPLGFLGASRRAVLDAVITAQKRRSAALAAIRSGGA